MEAVSAGNIFHPTRLGAKLLAMWDAEEADTFTHVANVVSAWAPIVGTGTWAQTTEASKPTRSTTALNNRPALAFDGSNDFMTITGIGPFPSGSNTADCEVFVLEQNDTLDSDTTGDVFFTFGGATTTASARMSRSVSTGIVRRGMSIGTGTGNPNTAQQPADRAVPHLSHLRVFPGGGAFALDRQAESLITAVSSIGTSRCRIGASESATAASHAMTRINVIMLTSALSPSERQAMKNWCFRRGGI